MRLVSGAPRLLLGVITTMAIVACGGDGDGTTDPVVRGDIEGTVLTLESSRVAFARVDLRQNDSLLATVLADSEGSFRFTGLEVGTYSLHLSLPAGYEDVESEPTVVKLSGELVSVTLRARAIRDVDVVIQPGATDTLEVASGAFVAVSAQSATSPVHVELEEVESTAFAQFGETSQTVSLRINPGAEGSGTSGTSRSAAAGLVTFEIFQLVTETVSDVFTFIFNLGDEEEPLYLFADATTTTYTDPRTGKVHTVALHSVDLDVSESIQLQITSGAADTQCPGNRQLYPLDGDETADGRIPLVLIHGWQPAKLSCPSFNEFRPEDETFAGFLEVIQDDPDYSHITERYKIYMLRYPTNERILATSEFLWNEIDSRELDGAVLIGHSMGGLVGRAMMAAHADELDRIGGLITLGTPHEGSPLGDYAGTDIVDYLAGLGLCGFTTTALDIGATLIRWTNGVDDLREDSDLIQALVEHGGVSEKVYTFGGKLRAGDRIGNPILSMLACVTAARSFEANDGVVTVGSAVPEWTTLQTVVEGHDHFEMASGDSDDPDELMGKVSDVLDGLATCVLGPDQVTENDFPLSGAVARVDGHTVAVTLNPIIIGGEPVVGLEASNFQVIENGCRRPIADFGVGSGSIGVDIVFAQDLSSSMGGAISGVRNSVIDFANDLETRGLNVAIGSIGYSGPATIPTTPATSYCEFLGPYQDLTDPVTFRDHVGGEWYATGGCDGPENGLEGIEYAHQNVSWRAGAARVYIDITDISHHTAATNCNGEGACTDQTLESMLDLVGSTSTVHAVAPADEYYRTYAGGLDPWLLAEATGGQSLALGSGNVDLTALGIAEVIGETVTFTFQSMSATEAVHSLRIRVQKDGKVAELIPGVVYYAPIHRSLAGSR